MSQEARVKQARTLLTAGPMSRHALERCLGVSQQRVSELMREIGARIVGREPRKTRGQPHPIYGLEQHKQTTHAHDFSALGMWK